MIILVAVNIDTLSIISAVLITNRFLMFIIYSQFWDTILFPWIINYISISILINITINISACIWRHSLLHIILSKYTLIKFPTDWISFSLHYLILRLSKLFFRNFIYSVSSSVLQFYITIMFSKLISFLAPHWGKIGAIQSSASSSTKADIEFLLQHSSKRIMMAYGLHL